MALDITVNVNYTPPSGDWIEDSAILAQRNALAALHDLGGDPATAFTGITDTTGYTTYTATNANELMTALRASSTTATTKKLITCNWNGTSSITAGNGYNCAGPQAANLTGYVNAGADVGYDTPPHYTKVVAGEGYSPTVGAAADFPTISMEILGFAYLEFDGISFTHSLEVSTDGGSVIPTLLAIRNGTFTSNILATTIRLLHLEDCVFDGTNAGVSIGTQTARIWNNECINKTLNGDFIIAQSYSHAWKAGWTCNTWVAGTLVHSMDEVTTSESHFDWMQYGSFDHTPTVMNFLIEFNMVSGAAPGSQGFYADGYAETYQVNICIHNNIITTDAYWNIRGKDPSGTGTINIHRNTCLRAPGNYLTENTSAIVTMGDATSQTTPTTGEYLISENYGNTINAETVVSAATTITGNRTITNSAGPNYVADVFTGNGSWSVGSFGVTYDDPGAGLSRAAAFAAIRDFFEPIGGYRTGGYGCTDPDTWPAPGAAWS